MKVRILAETDGEGVKHPSGLKIEKLPTHGQQRIHKDALLQWAEWVTLSKGELILHTVDGDVKFNINHAPGRYCLTCDKQLPPNGVSGSEEEAKAAKACRDHVAEHGDDAVTTDRWPNGYMAFAKSFDCSIVKSKLTEKLQHG